MKNLYLIILTAVFISCETTTEVKYGGMFTGGQNSYDLQQGSIEYASIIKNVFWDMQMVILRKLLNTFQIQ